MLAATQIPMSELIPIQDSVLATHGRCRDAGHSLEYLRSNLTPGAVATVVMGSSDDVATVHARRLRIIIAAGEEPGFRTALGNLVHPAYHTALVQYIPYDTALMHYTPYDTALLHYTPYHTTLVLFTLYNTTLTQ